jgi:hypothetical protein
MAKHARITLAKLNYAVTSASHMLFFKLSSKKAHKIFLLAPTYEFFVRLNILSIVHHRFNQSVPASFCLKIALLVCFSICGMTFAIPHLPDYCSYIIKIN